MEAGRVEQEEDASGFFNILRAPDKYAGETNLYDQPPFNGVLTQIVSQYPSLDKMHVAHLIGFSANRYNKNEALRDQVAPIIEITESYQLQAEVEGIFKRTSKILDLPNEIPYSRSEFKYILHELATLLVEYPYWHKYLERFSRKYDRMGRLIWHTYNVVPDYSSYASWVVGTLAREPRLRLSGLEEELPKGLERPAESTHGPDRLNLPREKRWKVLKASNLTRPD